MRVVTPLHWVHQREHRPCVLVRVACLRPWAYVSVYVRALVHGKSRKVIGRGPDHKVIGCGQVDYESVSFGTTGLGRMHRG
jgi:hypothetical protein